jgi:hypothetical protein
MFPWPILLISQEGNAQSAFLNDYTIQYDAHAALSNCVSGRRSAVIEAPNFVPD